MELFYLYPFGRVWSKVSEEANPDGGAVARGNSVRDLDVGGGAMVAGSSPSSW